MRDILGFTLVAAAVVGWALIAASIIGCEPPPKAPPDVLAEAAYTSDLLRCVDDARTLAESKVCEARVNQRWGIVTHYKLVRDGGAE